MTSDENIPRLTRLTAILLKLQTHSHLSVKQLSTEFQVSKRTIYRDLIALERSGVPLISEEGKGYSILSGYNVPPVMFTESEANALIVAEQIINRTHDESLISEFAKVTEKVKAVLNDQKKAKANLLANRTIIGKNWSNDRNSSYLSSIKIALTNYKLILIDYQKDTEKTPTQRRIEPFAIYHNPAEQWVVIAWCQLRKDFRSFRLDRIKSLRVLSEFFQPHTMTLEEYIQKQRERHFSK